MTYITLAELKVLLGSNSSNFTDDQLTSIINKNNARINRELNVRVVREPVKYINNTKQNIIDGTNSVYYLRNWFGKYISDANNDGEVTLDDISVYSIDADGIETELTISSINTYNNSFTVSIFPENVQLYVTYQYSFYDMSSPCQDIKDLAEFLCLKDSFFDIEIDLIGTSAKMGNLSVAGLEKNTKTQKYSSRAKELLTEMKRFSTGKRKPVMFNIARARRYRREYYLSNPNINGNGDIYPSLYSYPDYYYENAAYGVN